MQTLGQLINQYRNINNLSLREFAKICDVSHSYIDKLEKGIDPRNGKPIEPTIDTVERIAQAMNMSLEDVLLRIGKISSYKEERLKKSQSLKDELIDIMIKRGIIKNTNDINEEHLKLIEYAIKTYADNTNNLRKDED